MVGDVGFEYLDRARSDEFFARLKADTIGMLAIGPGDRVIDVGCGTGEDVVAISAAAADVVAVGLDLSLRNVVEARGRHEQSGAAFIVADAHALPMASACLDGCRLERTLQHVVDPTAVVAELARTLRPGGRVVLSEPDWASCTLTGHDEAVADSVLAHWIGAHHANPRVGRNLAGLMVDAGLEPMSIRCEAVVYRSLDEAELAFPVRRAADHAATTGVIERQTADAWVAALADASARGRFVLSIPLFTAVGVKPN